MKRSAFIPGVQFRIIRPFRGIGDAVYCYEVLDASSKHPTHRLVISNLPTSPFRQETILVEVLHGGLKLVSLFGDVLLESELIPFSRLERYPSSVTTNPQSI